MQKYVLGFLVLLFCFTACEEAVYTPKPRGYPRIEFPKRSYDKFDEDYCQFSFEKPTYAVTEQDQDFFGEKPESPCWFNLNIASLNAQIHFTYKEIGGKNTLTSLVNDSYTFANKHNIKAEYIDDYFIQKPNKVYCRILEIEGEVASPFQFYVTDSTSHFLRGSLYFKSQPRRDSLAPAIAFIEEDILKMINTFEWE